MEAWLSWAAARSPDYAEKKLDVWKILGSCILNTAAKVISDVEPVRTGNMLIALTGPSGSIKSWALSTMRLAAPKLTVPAGTPEYLLEAIDAKRVGVIYESEIGNVLKVAGRGGYMKIWGDIIDKIYDLDVLEAGRRKAKSVFVEPRSYYTSVCTAGTPKDYTGIFSRWPGLKRRFLVLNMEEVAPPKIWKPTPESAEALARLHAILEELEKHVFLVVLENWEAINNVKLSFPSFDPVLKRKYFEYAMKMFYALVVDRAVNVVVGGNSGGNNVKEYIINIKNDTLSYKPTLTADIKNAVSSFVSLFKAVCEESVRLSVVTVDCQSAIADVKAIVGILNRQLPTLPTFEAPVEEYSNFVEDVREMLKGKDWITLRDICRNRNWPKAKALPYLESLEEAGEVVLRRRGRSTVVLRADAELCGTCRHFMDGCHLDPNKEGYINVFSSPCECYKPIGEGEDENL